MLDFSNRYSTKYFFRVLQKFISSRNLRFQPTKNKNLRTLRQNVGDQNRQGPGTKTNDRNISQKETDFIYLTEK